MNRTRFLCSFLAEEMNSIEYGSGKEQTSNRILSIEEALQYKINRDLI